MWVRGEFFLIFQEKDDQSKHSLHLDHIFLKGGSVSFILYFPITKNVSHMNNSWASNERFITYQQALTYK